MFRWATLLKTVAALALLSFSLYSFLPQLIGISRFKPRRTDGSTPSGHPVTVSAGEKRVLVTGAGGFIGFHLCKMLATQPDTTVIAMDNFNDYYDVRLKMVDVYIYGGRTCTSAPTLCGIIGV